MTDRADLIEQALLDAETSTWVDVPRLLADLDAADRAAGIVRVDTNDEALVELVAMAIHSDMTMGVRPWGSDHGATRNAYRESARAVLAALREAS